MIADILKRPFVLRIYAAGFPEPYVVAIRADGPDAAAARVVLHLEDARRRGMPVSRVEFDFGEKGAAS